MSENLQVKESKTHKERVEYIQMYYEHQYQRMEKHEDQRHAMTNIIVTLSVLAFTFGLEGTQNFEQWARVTLLLFIFVANGLTVLYIDRTRGWARSHQNRAKTILQNYANYLLEIDNADKENFDTKVKEMGRVERFMVKGIGSTGKIHKLLHISLMIVAIVLVFVSFL